MLLEGALHALERTAPDTFVQLFERGGVAPMPAPEVAAPLVAFDLAELVGNQLRGLLRVRRREGRFYVMALGLGSDLEYQQDVWPETDALLEALEPLPPGRLLDL